MNTESINKIIFRKDDVSMGIFRCLVLEINNFFLKCGIVFLQLRIFLLKRTLFRLTGNNLLNKPAQ